MEYKCNSQKKIKDLIEENKAKAKVMGKSLFPNKLVLYKLSINYYI